jgi:hypothetical protein
MRAVSSPSGQPGPVYYIYHAVIKSARGHRGLSELQTNSSCKAGGRGHPVTVYEWQSDTHQDMDPVLRSVIEYDYDI